MSSGTQLPNGEGGGSSASELRDRKKGLTNGDPDSEEAHTSSPTEQDPPKDAVTWGNTPDGTRFRVPQTYDVLSSIFNPTKPKTFLDLLILGVLALQVILFIILPPSVRRLTSLVIFLFWRTAYDLGLGYLLHEQSVRRALIAWVQDHKIFSPTYKPARYAFIKRQLTSKMGSDYDISRVPVEYNTWLLFRRLVDLILVNDFVSYALFAVAWVHFPEGHSWIVHTLRWAAGWVLAFFNIWVKMDAHRVVKDFAWYWGDFFFLVDQSLTFDGVFEMAPHPMYISLGGNTEYRYSVGYAFYYGVSMMTASYTVLFTSLAAHAAQFAFLILVENPHIDKTYNATPRRSELPRSPHAKALVNSHEAFDLSPLTPAALSPSASPPQTLSIIERTQDTASPTIQPNRDLIVFHNFDACRSADLSLVVIIFYTLSTLIFSRGVSWGPTFIVAQAITWRLLHSVGLGLILKFQSSDKLWTKHFIKHGSTPWEAWSQWKSIYNTSLCLTYVSFFLACLQHYQLPRDWTYGTVLLRHTLGFLLIGLHMWTSVSIHEVLGDFGWFFGDFFVQGKYQLTYTGIYRYLNNPERLMGSAAFWGMSLISSSSVGFSLALLAQVCNLLFIQLVEKPHMEKLYGAQIRREAGLTKSLKRATKITLPDNIMPGFEKTVKEVKESVDKVVAEAVELWEERVEKATPLVKASVAELVRDLEDNLEKIKGRFTITLTHDNLNIDRSKYSISLLPSVSVISMSKSTRAEVTSPLPLRYKLGSPIHIAWTAPPGHSRKDWIGLYRVIDVDDRDVTKIASRGKWMPVCPAEYDDGRSSGIVAVDETKTTASGEVSFRVDCLVWKCGVYEARYHHDGKHNVMAISRKFEIYVEKPTLSTTDEIERCLTPFIHNCFPRDSVPRNIDDKFILGKDREKETISKRIVYGIREMFGVEFAWQVVETDGCVRRLVRRIEEAKRALRPFEGSGSIDTM